MTRPTLHGCQQRYDDMAPPEDGPCKCDECAGTGRAGDGSPCPACAGMGWIGADGEPCGDPEDRTDHRDLGDY